MGPAKQVKVKAATFDVLRRRDTLWPAWLHVREKARKSTSSETRVNAQQFAVHEVRNIERIAEELRTGKFKFAPAKAVLISKPGKTTKRPVVIAPVESRIVQRALLDLIQAQPQIAKTLKAGFNFGGVEGPEFGVPAAVKQAQAIARSKSYYIRTDIKSFFTQVPRATALDKVLEVISDPALRKCIKEATDTELADVSRLGSDVHLFPIHEEGVAQGSCLSPLLCNLLLADFDEAMNGRGIACIRYIDDFILLADSKRAANRAFASACRYLQQLGLGVYDPESSDKEERQKADCGLITDGFDFLGCTVRGDLIRPAKKNRDRLRENVQHIFDEALGAMVDPHAAALTRNTYAEAIRAAGLVIRGWGNTHSFCTDSQIMKAEDGNLGKLFDDFNNGTKQRVAKLGGADKRRVLGLFLLQDCNVDAALK